MWAAACILFQTEGFFPGRFDVFKHILVATDGSTKSVRAIKGAIALSNTLRARLTCIHVAITFAPSIFIDGMAYGTKFSTRQYEEFTKRHAKRALRVFDRHAEKAGIARDSQVITADEPWQGILRAARENRSELIVMASHGRRGIAGLVLGSETIKVLTHSKLPVLVYR
jgi:nucleotide-binding universal stress UspA family protein